MLIVIKYDHFFMLWYWCSSLYLSQITPKKWQLDWICLFYALVRMLLNSFVPISTIKKCSSGTNSFNNYVQLSPNIMHIFSNCIKKKHFLHHCRKLVQIKSSLNGSCNLAASWFLSLYIVLCSQGINHAWWCVIIAK